MPKEKIFLKDAYPDQVDKYWDYEKNDRLGIYPVRVTKGSTKKAWFKCPIDGHEWKARLSHIFQSWGKKNSGCPACKGNVATDKNSLITLYPEQMNKYWNHEKNALLGIYPSQATKGSDKKAWFKCPIDGHEWEASIASITHSWKLGNSGCPACRGLSATENNSLNSLYPDQVNKYWDYQKNNQLGIYPDMLTKGTHKKAWFRCPIDGYEWKASIASITKSWRQGSNGCSACSGLVATENNSLNSLYPDQVDKYWDYKKNNLSGIYPDQITKSSHKIIHLRCPIDGHQWGSKTRFIVRRWDKRKNICQCCSGNSVGFLYLIRQSLTPFCKIGVTKKPDRRLSQLQTSNPHLLEMVVCIHSMKCLTLEKSLHEYYNDYKMSGEWFELPDECIKNFVSIVYKLDSKNNFINQQLQLI